MLQLVASRTPAGARPTLFIGGYQEFGNPAPLPSASSILAQAFTANGAVGLVGFGWEAATNTDVPSTDPGLRTAIGQRSAWIRTQKISS